MNLELTIITAAITFIVMLIILANLHTKMRTIVILLNTLVKKLTILEEKIKWDNEYIKSKLTKEEKKNDNITWTK
jgi:hypothetical protein